MEFKEIRNEIFIIFLASIVLALSITFRSTEALYATWISFFIIIGANVLAKKISGYLVETNVQTKFWSIYQFGFSKGSHFKKPVPMVWFPIILSLFTRGLFWWLAILEFDVKAKTERVSKRHGLYRFTQVTEWHMALIAISGIVTNLALAVIGYISGFESFAQLNIYFAMWSIIPISNLDGSKIFFSSRGLWLTLLTILVIVFSWGKIII